MVNIGGVNPGMADALRGFGTGPTDVAREVFQKSNEFCQKVNREIEENHFEQLRTDLQRVKVAVARLGLGTVSSANDIDSAVAELRQLKTAMQDMLRTGMRDPLTPLTDEQMSTLQRDIDKIDQLIGQLGTS